jgi:DNA-binding NarL/FixJ family response regulator
MIGFMALRAADPPCEQGAPRVLLADDHAPIRLSVAEDLASAGFDVCAQVGTAREAVEAALEQRPELCVLDVSMPGGGLAAASEIRALLPETCVVMLTVSEQEEDFLEAIRSGVSGYLLKDMDPLRMPHALCDVLAGVPAFPRRLVPSLVSAAREALGPAAVAAP